MGASAQLQSKKGHILMVTCPCCMGFLIVCNKFKSEVYVVRNIKKMSVTVGQDESTDHARAKRTPLRYLRKHNKLKMILFL